MTKKLILFLVEGITEEILSFLDKEHYNKGDILEIIHLLDTDGAYISEDFIEKHEKDKNYYYSDKLCTRNPENTKKRNDKKSRIMDRLSSHSKINGIPYKAYYLSCNLEHVLHNDANIDDSLKVEKAEEFSDSYFGRELEFLDFIRTESFAVESSYKESWEFIKQGNNSLNRYRNSHLVFKNI